jgi:hypothetical protein
MKTKRYAIMIPFEDSWIYVIIFDDYRSKVMTFDTLQEAEEASRIWKTCKVVEYES